MALNMCNFQRAPSVVLRQKTDSNIRAATRHCTRLTKKKKQSKENNQL
jgi:hypothetical protein